MISPLVILQTGAFPAGECLVSKACSAINSFTMSTKISRSSSRGEAVPGCLHFTYEELKDATNGFDVKPLNMGGRKLGEGGFGPVFLGRLKFTEVAIKILRNVPKVSLYCSPTSCHSLPTFICHIEL